MQIKIDRDVPIPEGRVSYPFERMAIGDSIGLPTLEAFVRAYSAAKMRARRTNDMRFTARRADRRIWRIA